MWTPSHISFSGMVEIPAFTIDPYYYIRFNEAAFNGNWAIDTLQRNGSDGFQSSGVGASNPWHGTAPNDTFITGRYITTHDKEPGEDWSFNNWTRVHFAHCQMSIFPDWSEIYGSIPGSDLTSNEGTPHKWFIYFGEPGFLSNTFLQHEAAVFHGDFSLSLTDAEKDAGVAYRQCVNSQISDGIVTVAVPIPVARSHIQWTQSNDPPTESKTFMMMNGFADITFRRAADASYRGYVRTSTRPQVERLRRNWPHPDFPPVSPVPLGPVESPIKPPYRKPGPLKPSPFRRICVPRGELGESSPWFNGEGELITPPAFRTGAAPQTTLNALVGAFTTVPGFDSKYAFSKRPAYTFSYDEIGQCTHYNITSRGNGMYPSPVIDVPPIGEDSLGGMVVCVVNEQGQVTGGVVSKPGYFPTTINSSIYYGGQETITIELPVTKLVAPNCNEGSGAVMYIVITHGYIQSNPVVVTCGEGYKPCPTIQLSGADPPITVCCPVDPFGQVCIPEKPEGQNPFETCEPYPISSCPCPTPQGYPPLTGIFGGPGGPSATVVTCPGPISGTDTPPITGNVCGPQPPGPPPPGPPVPPRPCPPWPSPPSPPRPPHPGGPPLSTNPPRLAVVPQPVLYRPRQNRPVFNTSDSSLSIPRPRTFDLYNGYQSYKAYHQKGGIIMFSAPQLSAVGLTLTNFQYNWINDRSLTDFTITQDLGSGWQIINTSNLTGITSSDMGAFLGGLGVYLGDPTTALSGNVKIARQLGFVLHTTSSPSLTAGHPDAGYILTYTPLGPPTGMSVISAFGWEDSGARNTGTWLTVTSAEDMYGHYLCGKDLPV